MVNISTYQVCISVSRRRGGGIEYIYKINEVYSLYSLI